MLALDCDLSAIFAIDPTQNALREPCGSRRDGRNGDYAGVERLTGGGRTVEEGRSDLTLEVTLKEAIVQRRGPWAHIAADPIHPTRHR